ncbi:hypothetical protein [Marinomonas ostreistagni]|uniref:hypothetical protein n=1 Tax=Marinomonas ostreistagni TaxID=359209 RepID=UPI001950295D|nr:hypothetical protein [Marinomonas ostreistagni]MBM6549546.1 hypothetical protein [Marinomonas ostreistagni]
MTMVVLVVVLIALGAMGMALWRFYAEQKLKQHKELQALTARCYKIIDLLNLLSDRYLSLMTKTVLIEYLIASIHTIERHGSDRELASYLPQYLQWLAELKDGTQASLNDKVQTHLQLTQVQAGLQVVPLLLRGLVTSKVIDQATAKEEVSNTRFAFCLAHHDLLLKEAEVSLDDDKKARALEKMRLALAEMEKVVNLSWSEPYIEALQIRIKSIEAELFGKKPRAS